MQKLSGTATPARPEDTPALSVRGISKTFPGTVALSNVSLDVRPGEIHALVGANGSGKSTLIKILAGFHDADAGSRASLDGEEFSLEHAAGARHEGLRFVHQDLGLVLELNAMDNLALRGGFAKGPGHRVRWKEQARRTREILEVFDADLDIRAPLAAATPVQRTIVAICAALSGWQSGSGVLVLDEPTAVLPPHEVNRLLDIVARVREEGASVLYVSHRLDEIFRIADRVTVLRDGVLVTTRDLEGLTGQKLAELMVGEGVDASFRAGVTVAGDAKVALEGRALRARFLNGVDFTLREGEILGLTGLPGSGAEELPYLLAGAVHDEKIDGEVRLAGGSWRPIKRATELGLPLAPADRARDGIVADFSVGENISLSVLSDMGSPRRLSRHQERLFFDEWISRVRVKTASAHAPIGSLSGGNQQKVVMARCLSRSTPVLLLSEPTAGVDVGSRQALYELIAAEAANGLSVVVASTDAEDLLALCTRVLVLSHGRVVRELSADEITESALLEASEAFELPA